ncbi:hypothetical protein EIP86_000088 [Pleurotus ostreatoroseus]|nr:hypothetical protein EIP86_000088 [Pleurotus ostreatoroseus]
MSRDTRPRRVDLRGSIDNAERGLSPRDSVAGPQALGIRELGKASARRSARRSQSDATAVGEELKAELKVLEVEVENAYKKFWRRFNGEGKVKVGWRDGLRNVFMASWINILFLLVPIAWASHFMNTDGRWPHQVTFALCFVSIIPMENIFEWGGEQLAIYLGKDLGDLVVISLNNAVETALAIILLKKCE